MPSGHSVQVESAIVTRLQTILIADGYNTDAGNRVTQGRRTFDPSELPALSVFIPVVELDDSKPPHAQRNDCLLQLVVEGHITAVDMNMPAVDGHALISDIKRAMFDSDDRTLGGLVNDFRWQRDVLDIPDDGSHVVHVSVEALAPYPEIYGDPYYVLP